MSGLSHQERQKMLGNAEFILAVNFILLLFIANILVF